MRKLYVTVLAGGVGKRMQSPLPKVLHKIKGEPMIVKLLTQIQSLIPYKILIVVGKNGDQIRNEISTYRLNHEIITYVYQPEALGTGDAVKCTLPHLELDSVNIILNGDVPLLRHRTVRDIYNSYKNQNAELMITSIELDNPIGNGRIVINSEDQFEKIVEEKDCTDEEKQIKLTNCGIYVCNTTVLKEYVPQILNNNAQSEYYLTDLVQLYLQNNKQKKKVALYTLPKIKQIEIYNVNTKEQLEFAERMI